MAQMWEEARKLGDGEPSCHAIVIEAVLRAARDAFKVLSAAPSIDNGKDWTLWSSVRGKDWTIWSSVRGLRNGLAVPPPRVRTLLPQALSDLPRHGVELLARLYGVQPGGAVVELDSPVCRTCIHNVCGRSDH